MLSPLESLFAPICRLIAVLPPVRMFTPLNCVDVAMLSISARSEVNSVFRLARSVLLIVSLAACTASSRIRDRMLWASLIAPSAVWMRLMPSCALRDA